MVLELKHFKIAVWLIIYELVYILTFIVVGLILFYSSKASPVESIAFIKSHNALNAVVHIWLNNTTSFLIAAVFVILHPLLGIFPVAFMSVSSGELFASWLSNYCSTIHFIYGNIESQAYIILWLAVARTYYEQQKCIDLLCSWKVALKHTWKLLVYAFTTFLILAIVEIGEVLVFD